MDSAQSDLLRRIEAFPLDDPAAGLPFSRRLARDHRWTLEFAHRAIREYRRFMFLACVAGHPVSPPEPVDHVWHEHLIYTRSYWEEFCGQVLRQPLHHEPTRGGAGETAKFRDWYTRTLASYERFFGEAPPRDLWPPVEQVFARPSLRTRCVDFIRRLNRLQPRHAVVALRAGIVATLGATAAGCVSVVAMTNPLDLRGPEFLRLYVWLAFAAISIAVVIRLRVSRANVEVPEQLKRMDGYSVALLNGRDIAVNAAIAQLVERGVARVEVSGRAVSSTRSLPPDQHPLEAAVHERIHARTEATAQDAAAHALPVILEMEDDLRANGLLLPASVSRRAAFLSAAVCGVVLFLGIAKIFVGLQRGRPVALLVFASIVMLVVTLIFLLKRPRRTKEGDKLLAMLRKEHAPLRAAPLDGVPEFGGAALPLAIGLFGYGVLEHTQAADLRRRRIIQPPDSGSPTGGCSTSSGCSGGGSSCGGGGGCGGCGGSS